MGSGAWVLKSLDSCRADMCDPDYLHTLGAAERPVVPIVSDASQGVTKFGRNLEFVKILSTYLAHSFVMSENISI